LVAARMVHRAVKLRVRMQDHGDGRVLLLRRMIAAFEAAGRTGENHFGHWGSSIDVDRSIGWSGLLSRGANQGAREKVADAAGRRGCGPRSNMTQGAKIKEIVQLRGRETAS